MIPAGVIDDLIAQVDIGDYIGRFIALKRTGDSLKGLCPFHQEKTPSFSVSHHKQIFKCFGCGETGNVIRFAMRYEGLNFIDAVRKIADVYHFSLPESSSNNEVYVRNKSEKQRLLQVQKKCSYYFSQLLIQSPAASSARKYAQSRQLDSAICKQWQIGWAPLQVQDFQQWYRQQGITEEDLLTLGILGIDPTSKRVWLRYSNRLLFTISNEQGEAIGFSGRQIIASDKSGKYINSPESILFKKSTLLFGFSAAKQAIRQLKKVVICEGQLDVIACHQHDIKHVIAPLGTAFTTQQGHLIKRYCDEAILCFDADEAGTKAMQKAHDILAQFEIKVSVVILPVAEDPHAIITRLGGKYFQDLLSQTMDFFDFMIAEYRQRITISEVDLIKQIVAHVKVITDRIYQDKLIQKIALQLKISEHILRDELVVNSTKNKFKANDNKQVVEEVVNQRVITIIAGILICPKAYHYLLSQLETMVLVAKRVSYFETVLTIFQSPMSTHSVAEMENQLSQLPPTIHKLVLQQYYFYQENNIDCLAVVEAEYRFFITLYLQQKQQSLRKKLEQVSYQQDKMTIMAEIVSISDLQKNQQRLTP